MARSRSIPTSLFWDQDFIHLSSETQIILIGLTLLADDVGRGQAHLDILARQLDKNKEHIREALQELCAATFIVCYQIDHRLYYQHARWNEWETLSKPTPSRYPAPPHIADMIPFSQDLSGGTQENPGRPSAAQELLKQCPSEGEGKRRELEGEHEDEEAAKASPPNVVTFPSSRASDTTNAHDIKKHLTDQIAQILNLPVSAALSRIVEEYHTIENLSLPGEADAAREWVENKQRNRQGQLMSPAFFRRWLKRECERRRTGLTPVTGTYGPSSASIQSTNSGSLAGTGVYRSLMHLKDEYLNEQNVSRKAEINDR